LLSISTLTLLFKEYPGFEETVKFRNSRAVKESFAYAQELELGIRIGVKVKNFLSTSHNHHNYGWQKQIEKKATLKSQPIISQQWIY